MKDYEGNDIFEGIEISEKGDLKRTNHTGYITLNIFELENYIKEMINNLSDGLVNFSIYNYTLGDDFRVTEYVNNEAEKGFKNPYIVHETGGELKTKYTQFLTPVVMNYIFYDSTYFTMLYPDGVDDIDLVVKSYYIGYDRSKLMFSRNYRPTYLEAINNVLQIEFDNTKYDIERVYGFADFLNSYCKFLYMNSLLGDDKYIFGFAKTDKPFFDEYIIDWIKDNRTLVYIEDAIIDIFCIKAKLCLNKINFERFIKYILFDLMINDKGGEDDGNRL
jgi:hypothetical protein